MRRTAIFAGLLAVGPTLFMGVACSGSDSAEIDGSDAGPNLPRGSGGSDTGVEDPGFEAEGGTPLADVQAPPVDASLALNTLYGHVAGILGRFELTTGAFVEIGPTNKPSIAMAYDTKAGVMRVITDGGSAPAIGTINLCTGAITAGPLMKVGATKLDVAEALGYDSKNDVAYATIDADHMGTTTSEALGKVDMGNGATTSVGAFGALTDGDSMTFIGPTAYVIDTQTANTTTILYTVNTSTGAAKKVVNVDVGVIRVAYDSSRDVLFVAYVSTDKKVRRVAQMDRTTGVMTPVGTGIPEAMYAAASINALASAPRPSCP